MAAISAVKAAISLALLAVPSAAGIRGAAQVSSDRIWTWGGEGWQEWNLTSGKAKLLAKGDFGSGGCAGDLKGDGRLTLVVQERPGASPVVALTFDSREVIEPESEFTDCLVTTLNGRPGVLFAHFHSQLRLYYPQGSGRWSSEEIYSIYTASRQGGLIRARVDKDNFDDLLIGNYWVRNPGKAGIPWRLFAINTWHETPSAAQARLALLGERLVWAESEASPARVALFTPSERITDQWRDLRLPGEYHQPRGLVVAPRRIWIGDRSRIVELVEETGWTPRVLMEGITTVQLFLINRQLWGVTPTEVRKISGADTHRRP